jgi:hypothetical protein
LHAFSVATSGDERNPLNVRTVTPERLFFVATVDITVENRKDGKQQQADQVLKPFDIGVKINDGVNLLNIPDI